MSKDKLGQQPDEPAYGSKDQDKTRIRPPKAKPKHASVAGDLAAPGAPADSPENIPADDESSYTAVDVSKDIPVPADTQPLDTESVQPPPPPAKGARGVSLTPSDILKNRFILERVLGAGGMGVVYKAKDLLKVEAQDRDPYVAIKVLGEEFKYHPEAFIALQRESRKTQRIAHPNIVNVYDFDKDGDTVFMTMEYLEGIGLDVLIKKYRNTGGMPRADVWVILEGICSALAYAHDQNIIHADLKPGNIFVTQYNTAKVFDFGIARAVANAELGEGNDYEDKTLFDAGNLGALTPAYASLEMLEGAPPDVRDDIYALGCIAYEMFTGKHPYQRKNAKDAKKLGLKPARIEGLRKDQWRAIERALAFTREERIGSVHEFANLFKKKDALPPQIWMIAAVLLITLISGIAYLNSQADRQRQPRLSEDEVRLQIERKIRLEMLQKNIAEMIASPVFDERWERVLWERVQNLMDLLGMDNDQVRVTLKQVYGLYLVQIEAALKNNEIELAKQYIERGGRYHQGEIELQVLGQIVATVEEELGEKARRQQELREQQALQEERERQEQLSAERRQQEFDEAFSSINEQLQCNRLLEMDIFSRHISALRSLNMGQYNRLEDGIVQDLSACITKIAQNFPERAKNARSAALTLFVNNQTLLDLKISTPDTCLQSLAGKGAQGKRSICQDVLNAGGRSPRMVVIPAGATIPSFAIGKYEVTVAEINHYCRASGSCRTLAESNTALPATGLPFEVVRNYLAWLSAESGFTYRLPTFDEWQHAARASGDGLDANRNCKLDNRGINIGGALVNATVGRPNAWGVVNHVGNAAEWVTGGTGLMIAGGSYATPINECTLEFSQSTTTNPNQEKGFRVLRELAVAS